MALEQVLKAQTDLLRGSVRLIGTRIPDGEVVITRTVDRIPQEIRNGNFTSLTSGFIREDAEVPFGKEIIYRVTAEASNRYLQSNRVLNPKAKNNVNNWSGGVNRLLYQETAAEKVPPRDAVTSLRIPANTPGRVTRTVSERVLASTAPSGFGPGRWFFSGQMLYDSADLRDWSDAKALGTWQTVKDNGTWQQLRSSSTEGPGESFASLWAAVLGPTQTAQERRRNLVPVPAGTSTAVWGRNTGTGGVTTGTLLTGLSGAPATTAFRETWTTGTSAPGGGLYYDGRASNAYPVPVVAGQVYSAGISVRSSRAQVLRAALQWYSAAGTALTTVYGVSGPAAAGAWQQFVVNGATAPVGAAFAVLLVEVPSSTSGTVNWAAGDTLDGTAAMVELAPTFRSYFSGSTAASGGYTYAWKGTANASASVENVLDYPVVVAPFQVLGVSAFQGSQWSTFQAYVTLPPDAPSGSRLAFLQGDADREFSVLWWLTTVMVTPVSVTCEPEVYDTVQANAYVNYWQGLLNAGWTGHTYDGVEALYPPLCGAAVFNESSASNSTYMARWNALITAGWAGRSDDGLEALYPPVPGTRVIFDESQSGNSTYMAYWNGLILTGWTGRSDDGLEAVYAPSASRVVFNEANSGDATYLRYWEALSVLAGWVAKSSDGLEALYPPDCPERVIYDETAAAAYQHYWQGLVDAGWTARLNDGLDALYPPDCVDSNNEMSDGALLYFDGDSALPDNPARNLVPGYDWQTLSNDASMTWNGTENASISIFTGPSRIYAESRITVTRPSAALLPRVKLPVLLSDPVVPQLNQWFELLKIGDLGFAARAALYDVLSRGPQIAVSQVRAWASGELTLMTYTDDQRQVVERLFESGRILFLRNPDPRFPESFWYLHIGDVKQGRVGDSFAWAPERLWTVPFVRVERPEGLIVSSSATTWGSIRTAGLTWSQVRQARRDWLDVAVTAASS